MKKLCMENFGINKLVDVRTVTEKGDDLVLNATSAECEALAKRFDVPKILSLTVSGRLFWDDIVVFEGVIQSEQERICVVSLESFIEKTSEPFRLLFSDMPGKESSEMDVDEDIVLPVVHGKINLGEAIAEEFGVNLNPFPRKTTEPFEYIDNEPDEKEENTNPFSVLKNLTLKK